MQSGPLIKSRLGLDFGDLEVEIVAAKKDEYMFQLIS